MHLIKLFQKIFRLEGLDSLSEGLRAYTIQSTSSTSGDRLDAAAALYGN